MSNRHGLMEETYEEEKERPTGLWNWLKGYFGPDDPDMGHDSLDGDAPPSRRHHQTPGFLPVTHSQRQMRVSVRLNATTMEDAQEAVDSLKDRCQVILNLEHADEGMDRRILDFVSGACYALDGYYQRVGTKVFLFAPSNVYIEVEDDPAPAVSTIRPPSFLSQQA